MSRKNDNGIGIHILAVFCAVLIVTGVFTFWSHYKVMWFCDEIYTFFTANSEYGLGGRIQYGTWYDSRFVVDDLTADTSDGLFNRTIVNVKNDEHPPVYFLAIRLMSIIMDGSISKWVGLSINLFCVIAICIMTYILFYRITGKKRWAFLVSVAVCIVPSFLTNAMLIRMYCMLTLWGVLYTLLCYMILSDNDIIKKKRALYTGLSLTTTLGFLTQYYFAVFAVGFTALSCVYFIMKKRWNDIKYYLISMFSAVVFATILWKSWFRQMFLGYCGQDVLSSAFNFSSLLKEILYAFTCMPKLIFYDYYVVGILLILGGIIFLIIKKNDRLPIITILLGTSLFYCMVVAHVTPSYYMDARYFYLPTTMAYIVILLILVSCMEYIPVSKLQNGAISGTIVLLMIFHIWTAWYNGMAMGYVDKTREYFEKREVLKQYDELPWMFYGYECWSMMENYYDMALGSKFIVYNDMNDFDSQKCPVGGQDFIIMINSNSYHEPEEILEKLKQTVGCNHEFEYLFNKSAAFYLIRHK